MKLIAIFFTFLLLAPMAYSLAISPGRTVLDYEEGKPLEGTFTLFNTEPKEISIAISVQGQLGSYLSFSQNIVNLPAGQSKEISYAIRLPDVLPTDRLDSLIVAEDVSAGEAEPGAFIGVRLAVATQIIVHLVSPVTVRPEPQLAEGELVITANLPQEIAVGDVTNIDVQLANTGDLFLDDVKTELIIYNDQGNEVMRSAPTSYAVQGKSSTNARVGLNTAQLLPGSYHAKLIVTSGSKVIEREFSFVTKSNQQSAAVQPRRAFDLTNTICIIFLLVLLNFIIWFAYHSRRR